MTGLNPRKVANTGLLVSLAAIALILIMNVVWVDLTAAGTGQRADADTQEVFHVLGTLALTVLAASVILWVFTQKRRDPVATRTEGTEALLGLAERAGEYLRGLYLLLWLAGAYLLAFGFILIPFGDNLGIAYQDIAPRTGFGFSSWIALLLGSFWMATVIVWLVYLIRVGQEWRRWRAQVQNLSFD